LIAIFALTRYNHSKFGHFMFGPMIIMALFFIFTVDVLEQSVANVVSPIVGEEGLVVYDIYWTKDLGRRILRVLLEKKEGNVSLDDCSRVSHSIEDIIEVKGLINSPYDLEVSSPGLDRPLRSKEHFRKVVGQTIKLKTKIPLEGRQNYKGLLKKMDENILTMEIDQKDYELLFESVAKAHLCPWG